MRLVRRLASEALGNLLLAATVVGSDVMAESMLVNKGGAAIERRLVGERA